MFLQYNSDKPDLQNCEKFLKMLNRKYDFLARSRCHKEADANVKSERRLFKGNAIVNEGQFQGKLRYGGKKSRKGSKKSIKR